MRVNAHSSETASSRERERGELTCFLGARTLDLGKGKEKPSLRHVSRLRGCSRRLSLFLALRACMKHMCGMAARPRAIRCASPVSLLVATAAAAAAARSSLLPCPLTTGVREPR